jgi:alkylation response protein AidB-like acyl-CoA dehydrogenase
MLALGNSSPALEAVRNLAPEIAASAQETEDQRCIPPRIVDKLREAGIFRMLVPRRYGGDQLTEGQATAVIEELGAADGAAAWTAMVGAGCNCALSRFPRATLDKLYADGPDLAVRGAVAPLGHGMVKDGGYVVSGKWPFASGPFRPKWVQLGFVVLDGGKPLMGPMGPETRLGLVPADQVEFLDTWYTVGMRGTDSTDFQVKDVFIPNDFAINLFDFSRPQSYDVPLFNLPFPVLTGPHHSAVCLGLVRATLDELATLARTKRSAFNPTQVLGENPVFQHRLGELAVRHAALEALLERHVREIEQLAAGAAPAGPLEMFKLSSWTGYVHVKSVEIINEAFEMAGSTPVYSKSAIQRRWRDVRVAAQHFGGSTAQYPAYGGMLAGQAPRMPGQ